MIHILQNLLLLIGAVTAVGFVFVLWGVLYFAIGEQCTKAVQGRKDHKMFQQVEEFRRDFS